MNYTDEQIINIFADMVTFKTQYRGKDLSDVLSELDAAILKDVLNLIKRLKAENEKLNSLCTSKDVIINDLNAEVERLNCSISTSLKEFAEKLKDECSGNPYLDDYVLNKFIDNLLEEMEQS